MASFTSEMTIHLAQKAHIALLLVKKVIVLEKYSDFGNIFFKKSAEILPERTGINKHAIELQKSDNPPYSHIYSLGLKELKTLKTFIKINLANGFMQPLKFPTKALILFV